MKKDTNVEQPDGATFLRGGDGRPRVVLLTKDIEAFAVAIRALLDGTATRADRDYLRRCLISYPDDATPRH